MADLRICRAAALAAAGIALTLLLAGCGGGNGSTSSSSSAISSSGGSGTGSSGTGSSGSGSSGSGSSGSGSSGSGSSGSGSSGGGSSGGGSGSTSGSLTLNWTAPTENTDGTPVTAGELAGYKIVYGESSGALDESVAITDPTVTTYTFQNLPSGTYYFAVVSIDSEGNESQQTNPVSATI